MSFTEITTESWGSRLMKSIKNVLGGLALFVIAFPILFWNEGRAVRTAKSLEEGAGAVVSVAADKVEASNEGKLVHMSGNAATEETLTDDELGVSVPNAIKLMRTVEMFQWVETQKSETRKKTGGSTETITTYDYKKEWKDDVVDSSEFKEQPGHLNPDAMPYESKTFTAGKVTLGAFTLSPDQVEKIGQSESFKVAAKPEKLSEVDGIQINQGSIYIGEDPASPDIGDVRVTFEVVKPRAISIIGVQTASTFKAFQAQAGDAILLVTDGTVTADQMFKAAQEGNVVLTWILRLIGFVMMGVGLFMVFQPIAVFGDVIPVVGSFLGAGLGFFAFLISASLSLITIGIAWLFYRPLLGIVLLLAAGGAITLLVMRARKKKAAAPGGSPGAGPAPAM